MSAYLDTSVIVPLFVLEPASRRVAFRLAQEDDIVVSEFAAAEFASALSLGLRRSRFPMDQVQAALIEFDEWRYSATRLASIEHDDFQQAYAYVRHFELKLRAPDALHLAVARRLGATLVTLDSRLAEAAQALGVTYERP